MVVQSKTLKEVILEELGKQAEYRFSASAVEYFALIEDLEANEITVEFNGKEIITYMSQATEIHELLVGNLVGNLYIQLLKKGYEDFRVYGSNRPVYATECQKAFNADVLVVKGATELYPREKQVAATLNPRIVIEVLSNSNEGIGFLEKLNCYKKIESLKQILLVNQYEPKVSSYIRIDENEWLNHEYDGLDKNIKIEDFTLSANDIYRNAFD
ncbi:Uma2 family endonuclease [Emticicia sp. W12TSBA100-4]|uniref:Uma2 family endonuclease n=1 Tax=Emticicia sp. W12TSBA100-4 TaxID=3160965 RepID=UPI003305D6D1